jgi:hypothetical protein
MRDHGLRKGHARVMFRTVGPPGEAALTRLLGQEHSSNYEHMMSNRGGDALSSDHAQR